MHGTEATPTFVLVAGTTATAAVDGISAAGETASLMAHTPAADAEVLTYGRPVFAPIVPVSPEGCPTPALVSRAVRDLVGFDLVVIEAGIDGPSAAPSVTVGEQPGGDIREPEPVPDAAVLYERAREFAATNPAERLLVGETIPGGTTTALGVVRALGESYDVSSSLATNPLDRKRAVVDDALVASDLARGDLAGQPIEAIRRMGDPTLAVTLGLLTGGLESGKAVTLAGGTQMIAAGALARHAGVSAPFAIATTAFVAEDDSVSIRAAAADLDVTLHVTDPEFEPGAHVATDHYLDGVAKEGVGMGGALHLTTAADVEMTAVQDRLIERYEHLMGDDVA
ncbi:MAG: nicotinate-nucleotide--dimethylbenzimidazole phosphoribosyltransferase [Halolamina sp.]